MCSVQRYNVYDRLCATFGRWRNIKYLEINYACECDNNDDKMAKAQGKNPTQNLPTHFRMQMSGNENGNRNRHKNNNDEKKKKSERVQIMESNFTFF